MKIGIYFYAMLFIMALSSCSSNHNEETDCGKLLIINKVQFDAISTEPGLFIENPVIDENCLTVTLGYSGCNDGHDMSLITSGDIAESYPVQIHFKLLDNNPQACEAFFTEDYQFDLSPLIDLLTSEDKARLIFVQDNNEVLWEF